MEASDRVLDQYDFLRLHLYIYAKRRDAEDHLWSQRENPAQVRDTVREANEHRKEAIPCREGFGDPLPQTRSVCESLLNGRVTDAYKNTIVCDPTRKNFKALFILRD